VSASLIIWLPDEIDGPWAWRSASGQTGWAQTLSEKSELASLDTGTPHIVMSGQAVRILPHDLPDMRASEKQAAAGFAIEDQLAASPSDQHIVLHDQEAFLAVISRPKMAAILGASRVAGLSAVRIFADFDVVPKRVSETVRLDDRVITPGKNGFTQDPEWVSGTPEPERSYDLFSVLEALEFEGAINLAQGEFASQARQFPHMSGFKRAAVLAFMLGLSFLAWQGVQLRSLKTQTAQHKSEAIDIYKAATGRTVSNPARQIAKAIKTQPKSSGEFLTLSNLLFAQLRSVEGVEIDMLRYETRSAALTLRLIYPDFETAARLEQALISAGANFQSGGVREQNGAMIGEAVMSRKPV